MTKFGYAGYRFPPEVIRQSIGLYLRFTMSFRDVEDLLAERGIALSYETVRRWVNHFGRMIAAMSLVKVISPSHLENRIDGPPWQLIALRRSIPLGLAACLLLGGIPTARAEWFNLSIFNVTPSAGPAAPDDPKVSQPL